MLVLGILLAMGGFALAVGGAFAAVAAAVQGSTGYFSTSTERISSTSYALTSPGLNIMEGGAAARPPVDVGRIRLRVTPAPGAAVFIGIAPQADVDRYLSGVAHTEVTELRFNPFRVQYRDLPGTTVPAPPAGQSFWTASSSGTGTQEITVSLQPGSWAVVVMNANARPGVTVDLQAGFHTDLLGPVAAGLLAAAAVMLLIGVPLLVAGAMGLGSHTGAPLGPPPGSRPGPLPGYDVRPLPPGVPGHDARPYPAELTGHLDPVLSRWLWLVKWFLAIPHVVVLFFLWFALVVTTIVAGFAILFTGRYPRRLFAFNVGVLRWSWRVGFYAYSALGTDRYPPFTLARTDYPADFDVPYPERLSRGLVLVKSWLLAIPHLLIVGILTSGSTYWWGREGDYLRSTGPSLLGLLVLVAGVSLLFTSRYPRPLFALVIGLNRWVYRVAAYTALMRDEYPPFRLDQGPIENPTEPPHPGA
ncbi:DUF4389 domain-containing protein [Paenarthrobacter sp. DKR-5]|nr:DUF4389 domain-containing protein [Paenarthrobacter sp. DKR-5]